MAEGLWTSDHFTNMLFEYPIPDLSPLNCYKNNLLSHENAFH